MCIQFNHLTRKHPRYYPWEEYLLNYLYKKKFTKITYDDIRRIVFKKFQPQLYDFEIKKFSEKYNSVFKMQIEFVWSPRRANG